MNRHRALDAGSYLTVGATLVLFAIALFVKGLTHDLLLEAGVFLVSVKLILMSYKNSASADRLEAEIRKLRELLDARMGGPL